MKGRWLFGAGGLLMLLPILFLAGNSLMGTEEIRQTYGIVLGGGSQACAMRLLPQYPTLRAYVELLFDSPEFFVMFWNSCRQTASIVAGQALVAMPAAWAFARYRFRGRRVLFLGYMLLMVMPFQVTMVSNYFLLSGLSLLDTDMALILPGIFSAFPVCLMEKCFAAIPEEMIAAARVDGAGPWQIFIRIGVPLGVPGVTASLLLNFVEYWNAVEAPMTFLKTKAKLPLSLYLPEITSDRLGIAFAASVVMMVPAMLGFLWGKEALQQTIAVSGLKE